MLDTLTQRLASVVKTLRGHSRITEDNVQEMLREVRLALLDADAGLPVVKDFIARVKEKALGQEVVGSLTPGQALVGIVHAELVSLMGGTNAALSFATQPPAVILLAGLQGSGKTTSAGKLARLIRNTTKKKVLLVSTDVYRPAAIEQLATLAKNLDIEIFPSDASQKPVDIARAALDYARKHFHDVLIVDTAGRLAVDEAMMQEVKALHAAVSPIETLFVVDSMQGQDAVNVARAFNEALPLTGIVLTKLDGDSRGGAALSVRHVTGKPIKFVGVSEKMDGIEAFHPDRMASRILGMGDILSLVEEARSKVDEAEAVKFAEKIKKGKDFDLEDFRAQIGQMKKMGGLASLADKLPAQITQMAQTSPELQEKALKRTEAIINSMTPHERRKPELLKASRKRRIAAGAGVQVQEVNRLLAQFEQMRKMMKMMRGGNLMKMMRNMKGMMPGMR
ncbi:MAG TPA: signal recognition particle protein [Usitatibacter sp.]|nr:signal recognition particle protein [Usitatibacter sp.]